ncbi:MAG TPA: replication protein RepA [Terriglobia bacterium]|nr:replication protein RepA [Terriglobia bacterium]
MQSVIRSIGISKRRFKQVESICLIREQRARGRPELAFNVRPFVLCGLPLRRPPSTQLVHRRRNGRFFLHVVAHPDFGLPYGQDRLIPIWIATLAVKQKSRTVRFTNAIEMLNFFHFAKDGRYYGRLIGGFKRIVGATILFGTDEQTDGKPLIDWARFHFFDNAQLWFCRSESGLQRTAHAENVVTLSESFYAEIDAHRIPVEREIVALLANAPGALDFYIWLVWRSWTVKSDIARVPLFGNGGLATQLGCDEYSSDRYFRRKLCTWLRRVRTIWPQCPAHLSEDGTCLVIRPSTKSSPAVRDIC